MPLRHNDGLFEVGELEASSLCIYRLLAQYTKTNGNTFFLEGNPIESHLIYSPEMLLPVVALEAMRLWQSLERPANSIVPLEESLGVVFLESDTSFFPLAAYPPAVTQDLPSSLRLLCFNLANRRVFALKEGENIDLGPYLEVWKHIDWYSDIIVDLPVHKTFNSAFMRDEFSQKLAKQIDQKPKVASPFNSEN